MEFLIGVLGLLLLGGVYVGLGLADRARDGCGDCSLAEDPESCGSCPLVVAVEGLEKGWEGDAEGSTAAAVDPHRADEKAPDRRLPMWDPAGE